MWLKVRRFVKKRSLIFTLIGSSFLFSGVTAHAEEVTESFTLDPMVITATRTEMSVKESPSAVEIVSSKKLEETQAKTLRDALKSALGVNVFNDFQGRSNVSIRGSESRHVLIMVDGKRLGGELSYNSANAWDVDRIRMEDVERVEIIRGPAGALYGSDAMAGVINVQKLRKKMPVVSIMNMAGMKMVKVLATSLMFICRGLKKMYPIS